jgi:hypothetical protein
MKLKAKQGRLFPTDSEVVCGRVRIAEAKMVRTLADRLNISRSEYVALLIREELTWWTWLSSGVGSRSVPESPVGFELWSMVEKRAWFKRNVRMEIK